MKLIWIVLAPFVLASCMKFGLRNGLSPGLGQDSNPSSSPTAVARWQFENDWLDSVGSNHGTAVAPTNPTFTTDKLLGTYGADLSTANARVDLGNSVSLTPTNLTVSFWLKRTAPSVGSNIIMWAKPCTWDHADGYYIGREGTGKAVTLVVSGGNLIGLNDDPDVVFPLNAWTHVAITFDSTLHEGHIYVNGVDQPIVDYGTPQEILPSAGTTKYIGSCADGSQISWPLDELTVINGVLSATDVDTLYQTQKTAAGI